MCTGRPQQTLRYELADRAIEAEVEQMLSYQVIGLQKRGLIPNHEASVAKLFSTELDQRIAATGLKLLGLVRPDDEGRRVRGDERPHAFDVYVRDDEHRRRRYQRNPA